MESKINFYCEKCKEKFDQHEKIPMTLPCSHSICSECLDNFPKKKSFNCPKCNNEVQANMIKDLQPHLMILSFLKKEEEEPEDEEEESNTQLMSSPKSPNQNEAEENSKSSSVLITDPGDYCIKHKEKMIEFFCQTCTTTVCSICIFESHNGHHLKMLDEMSGIIKNNIKDFGKIMKNLEKVNEENQNIADRKIEEVEKQRDSQILLVNKSFDEILKKIESKKNAIIVEFTNKYFHEIKRFKKVQVCLKNDEEQMEKINQINEQLNCYMDKFSDAKILKKIDDFTSFLHKSSMDIKRLYKTEISLKAEMQIDPAMKPIPINHSEMISLLDKIDPKEICYPYDEDNQKAEDNMIKEKNHMNAVKKSIKNPIERMFKYDESDQIQKDMQNDINNYIKRFSPLEKKSEDEGELTGNVTDGSANANVNANANQRRFPGGIPLPNKRNVNNPIQKANYPHRNKINARPSQDSEADASKNILHTEKNNYQEGSPYIKRSRNNLNFEASANKNRNASADGKSKKPKANELPTISSHNSRSSDLRNTQSIYCIGDTNYALEYYIQENYWELIPWNEKSKVFSGGVRYCSLTTIPNLKLILTGGCSVANDEAVNICIEMSAKNINECEKLKNMTKKRYAHSSAYLKGYVYVVGGFDHKDEKSKSVLSTLKSCERYSLLDKKWEQIANLNHPRAFFGLTIFNNEFIFAFGGFFDLQILSSIEKYDELSDMWMTYYLKLPERLANMGVLSYKSSVIILGGINQNYDTIAIVRVLDMTNGQWYSLPNMLCPRTFNQSAFLSNKCIYAIGGAIEGVCEKFDFIQNRWEMIESYLSVKNVPKMDQLHNFAFALNYSNDIV